MNKEQIDKLIGESTRVSDDLSLLMMEKLLPWADMKEKLFKNFKKSLYSYQNLVQELPPEWEDACSVQYVAGKVLGSPSRMKKFFNYARTFLSSSEEKLVRYFRENPWFYSVFTVEEPVYNNLLRVFDHVEEKSLLLYSKGVFDLYREGKNFFLCLLFNWEGIYQTYGPINYFNGFDLTDLKCFAGLVSPHFKHTGNLSKAIARNPIPFYMLYSFAELPVIFRRNERMVICSHEIKVPDFDPELYAETFNIEEKQGVYRLELKNSKEPPYFYTVYFDSKKGLLSINSMGIKRYRELCSLLGSRYKFPQEPSFCVSMQMVLAIKEILGIEPPSHRFEELFHEEPEPDTDEELNRLNAMIGEINEMYNHGIPYSIEEIAEKYDFPVETVKQVQKLFQKFEKEHEIKIQGGFKEFTPPPPILRMKMKGSFKDNDLFKFNNSKLARALFSRQVLPGISTLDEAGEYMVEQQVEFSLSDLPRLIEDLYFKHISSGDYTILLYTMYLLSQQGESYHKVRDYAVEVLKIFWQVILPSRKKTHIRQFISNYAGFCYNVLYRVGLVEIEQEPDEKDVQKAEYSIKASSFFREWLMFFS